MMGRASRAGASASMEKPSRWRSQPRYAPSALRNCITSNSKPGVAMMVVVWGAGVGVGAVVVYVPEVPT